MLSAGTSSSRERSPSGAKVRYLAPIMAHSPPVQMRDNVLQYPLSVQLNRRVGQARMHPKVDRQRALLLNLPAFGCIRQARGGATAENPHGWPSPSLKDSPGWEAWKWRLC